MLHHRGMLGAGLVALVCSAAAWAEVPAVVDQRLPASATGRVVVEVPAGSVQINGTNELVVHVKGRIGKGTERFVFEKRGDDTVIHVELPKRSGAFQRVEGSHLEV